MSAPDLAALPGWLAPWVGYVREWPGVGQWPTSAGYLSAPRVPEPLCQVAVCDRTSVSLALCRAHYFRFRRAALADGLTTAEYVDAYATEVLQAPPVRTPERVCWVESCDRTAYHYGLCRAHHKTARRVFHGEEQRVGRASDSETRGGGRSVTATGLPAARGARASAPTMLSELRETVIADLVPRGPQAIGTSRGHRGRGLRGVRARQANDRTEGRIEGLA